MRFDPAPTGLTRDRVVVQFDPCPDAQVRVVVSQAVNGLEIYPLVVTVVVG